MELIISQPEQMLNHGFFCTDVFRHPTTVASIAFVLPQLCQAPSRHSQGNGKVNVPQWS
jgi:hypothetical protein